MFLGFCCWRTVAALYAWSVMRKIFVTGCYFNRFKSENMWLSPVFGQLSAYFRHQCWDALSFNQIIILYFDYFIHFSQQNNVSYLLKLCLWPNTLTPRYYNKLILLNCESLQYFISFSFFLLPVVLLEYWLEEKKMIRKLL